jgi:hypothetical protein
VVTIAGDTRDRVIALEVEVEHLRREVQELSTLVGKLTQGVGELNGLLNQARGGKIVIGLLLTSGGFIVGAIAGWQSLLRWLSNQVGG